MELYKFGKPEGRYIGHSGKFKVYSGSISMENAYSAPQKNVHISAPGEFDFYYGPATGGLLESVGMKLTNPGEIINGMEVNPDFKRRSIAMTGLTVEDALLRVERINGFHSASHAISFLTAVEDALGIEVPDTLQKTRIVMLELERIRSNMEVLKRMCEPAGFGVPVNQLGYLREKVSRIISEVAGHRFFFGVNGIGKAAIDTTRIGDRLKGVKNEFTRIFEGLQESKIFLNRLQNNGITRDEPLLGPAARAAGMGIDARLDFPVLPYSQLEFKPAIRNEKDCFARFMVRGEEILNSADLIDRIGFIANLATDNIAASGSGEGASRIESPQGDLFYYVKVKEGHLQDVWFVTPSELNISAFESSMLGNIFTDFHFNWESYGIWISEMGVEFR